jgi:hypothetical protein
MHLHAPSCGGHALSRRHAALASPMVAAAAATCKVPRLRLRCNASRAESSTDEQSEAPKPRMRRTRLFKASEGSESTAAAAPAPAPAQQAAEAGRGAQPVSEEFRKAFEDLGVRPGGLTRGRVSRVLRWCSFRNTAESANCSMLTMDVG